jgi:AN1-type zinc finger and ubiquitin domain-containing protein 1
MNSSKMPKTSEKLSSSSAHDANSFHHGASIFHYRSNQTSKDLSESEKIPQTTTPTIDYFDGVENNSSGRQSRFEYCNSYYSNLNQFALSSTNRNSKYSEGSNFDFQSEENLFNMNFDSFYEDFVDSAESWSSSSDSSSVSMYDKKYVVLPEIKLDSNDLVRAEKSNDKALLLHDRNSGGDNTNKLLSLDKQSVQMEQQSAGASNATAASSSGKQLRCFHCNKKLGIIMIMKCHCNQYFCSAHRYMEVHNCSYDYKENGRKKLERENPLIYAKKLPKI